MRYLFFDTRPRLYISSPIVLCIVINKDTVDSILGCAKHGNKRERHQVGVYMSLLWCPILEANSKNDSDSYKDVSPISNAEFRL